ncbi:hypothetical protein AAVH_41078, partial [Aphelenchoides avenae]
MVFNESSSDSPSSNAARRSGGHDISDKSDIFTTGGKSDDNDSPGSVSKGRFRSDSKEPEKENAPVKASQNSNRFGAGERSRYADSSSDIEITAEVVKGPPGAYWPKSRPEVVVTGEVLNKVYRPAEQSPHRSWKLKDEPTTSNAADKPRCKTKAAIRFAGGRKIEKRPLFTESSSDGSVPRGRGKLLKATGNYQGLSSSSSEHVGGLDGDSDIEEPVRKPVNKRGTGSGRSVVKGALAKSINVAYFEGSGDYDSDEWSSYNARDVGRKLVDYRPASQIP